MTATPPGRYNVVRNLLKDVQTSTQSADLFLQRDEAILARTYVTTARRRLDAVIAALAERGE